MKGPFIPIIRLDNFLYHLIPLDVAPPELTSYESPTPSQYPNAALNVLKTPTSFMLGAIIRVNTNFWFILFIYFIISLKNIQYINNNSDSW